MSDFEDRLKNELSVLGFDWDKDNIAIMPNLIDKHTSIANCMVSLEHLSNNGAFGKDILSFDFSISIKENQKQPLIDHMLTYLERSIPFGENPTILMLQKFQSY